MFQDTPDLTSFIMDAEIVAIDPMSGELKSFQELSNRAHKNVNIKDIRVAVCIYAFDLMLLNAVVRQPVYVFMVVLNNRTAFTWT
jgi:DNA ligase-1